MKSHPAITCSIVTVIIFGLITGCNSQTTRPTAVRSPEVVTQPIPEHLLLDAGIDLFDPGIEYLDEGKSTTTPSVRKAESVHAAHNVAKALQNTGNWGTVRIVPGAQSETDVYVTGVIVKSDGESLNLKVTVTDSAGSTWFSRTYSNKLSQYAYDRSLREPGQEPFQALYDEIARDMEQYARRIEPANREKLRLISKMRFAQRFAPAQYNDFMDVGANGKYTLKRTPAEGDPIIAHLESIRVRDQMFVDRLQDYYGAFTARLQTPYDQWREASYHETKALRKLKSDATARKIGGALAVVAGILAQASGSSAARTAGVLGIGGGAYLFKSGLDRGSEAQIHEEAMKEMADSLGAEVKPLSIELADKTVTLSGTVDEQYTQWRLILNDIYLAEVGQLPAQEYSDTKQ
ncbi:MAG: hypothetical protein ACI9BW_002467 [Gammaproteobacteria bacterium]